MHHIADVGKTHFKDVAQKWIAETNATEMVAKSGYKISEAHPHSYIAVKFVLRILAEFKLYLVRKLKRDEEEQK